jgi:hypothetical protein
MLCVVAAGGGGWWWLVVAGGGWWLVVRDPFRFLPLHSRGIEESAPHSSAHDGEWRQAIGFASE